jgi:hypothetical protein
MPKANGYAKIAKRILILHSRANKLQADLLALEAVVSTEAKKVETGASKAKKPVAGTKKVAAAVKKPTTGKGVQASSMGAAKRTWKPSPKK